MTMSFPARHDVGGFLGSHPWSTSMDRGPVTRHLPWSTTSQLSKAVYSVCKEKKHLFKIKFACVVEPVGRPDVCTLFSSSHGPRLVRKPGYRHLAKLRWIQSRAIFRQGPEKATALVLGLRYSV